MSIHEGHRERLKERFRKEGLDHFTEIQALELMLFYTIPRRDTNPIAHALLETFGSFSQVVEAPVEELMKVKGVGQSTAQFLAMVPQLGRYYQKNRDSQAKYLYDIDQCARYLLPFFFGRRSETVFLLCLDAKCKMLCCRELGDGDANSAGLSVRKVVETALGVNSSSVVLAHNHPSGLAIPSAEDVLTTRQLAMALQTVDVQLVDHIIVADGDYVSMAQSGHRFRDCLLV